MCARNQTQGLQVKLAQCYQGCCDPLGEGPEQLRCAPLVVVGCCLVNLSTMELELVEQNLGHVLITRLPMAQRKNELWTLPQLCRGWGKSMQSRQFYILNLYGAHLLCPSSLASRSPLRPA